jgi:hypothetical protein
MDFDLRLIFIFQTFVVFKVWDTNIVIDLFHDTFEVLSCNACMCAMHNGNIMQAHKSLRFSYYE